MQTGAKVDIDKVIADIENAIAENGDGARAEAWIAEAESLAKSATIEELNQRCDKHKDNPMIVPAECWPVCGGCEDRWVWSFAKEVAGGYALYLQCANCREKSSESIPFRICGKERVVTTIAVYLREKADGFRTISGRRDKGADTGTRHEHGAGRFHRFAETV